MFYTLQDINPKEYEGSVVFLYGDECAERNLPLAKKEVERIKNEELRNKKFRSPTPQAFSREV